MLASTLFIAALLAAPTPAPGTLATYEGSMIADKGEVADTQKLFELQVIYSEVKVGQGRLYWQIAETGRGSWHWTERFGRLDVDGQWRRTAGEAPALLYRRDDGASIVPLLTPVVAGDGLLSVGSKWKHDKLNYEVVGSGKSEGHTCWKIEARNSFGRTRRLNVDKSTGEVITLAETVFIGRGEQFELKYKLTESEQVGSEKAAKIAGLFDALMQLRQRVGRESRRETVDFEPDQIAIVKERLPELADAGQDTHLKPLLTAATRDLKSQGQRSVTVAAMEKQAQGKDVTKLTFEDLRGKPLPAHAAAGDVTVLHFWEYQSTPLKEPYGQAAYLDFLYRSREKEGLNVIGVRVDGRIGSANSKRNSLRDVKKFKSFMNLSYPLAIDDGRALRTLGDPRLAGARLPLFVVVDSQGKIVHYKVGFYEV
ncbi:MAG: TlpA disulfide reductase family protein, partial [Pirellulaceae bacterium]|nr:TlpA disulfide reductase family protein [Pirellulaceae bacterium]